MNNMVIPEQVKNTFISQIEEKINSDGFVVHSYIPSLIKGWSQFKNESNETLASWLSRNFGDVFTTVKKNKAPALMFPKTASVYNSILELIHKVVDKQDSGVQISLLERMLEGKGLDWQMIPKPNKYSLGDWILAMDGGLTVSNGKIYGCEDSVSAMPVLEYKQHAVFKFAYIAFTGAPLYMLKDKMGDPAYSIATFKRHTVELLYEYLLLGKERFFGGRYNGQDYIAFPFNLKTKEGKNIFCILSENVRSGAIQRWVWKTFCYPGEDEPSGYGKLLCVAHNISSESQGADRRKTIQQLEESVIALKNTRQALLENVNTVTDTIENGKRFSVDLENGISEWINQWNSINELALSLNFNIMDLSIDGIVEFIDKQDTLNAKLQNISNIFRSLTASVRSYFEKCLLLGDSDETLEDEKAWNAITFETEIWGISVRARYEEVLSAYEAIRTISSIKMIGRLNVTITNALEEVNKHFKIELMPYSLRKFFMEMPEETFDFLWKIDEIKEQLSQIDIEYNQAEDSSNDDGEMSPESIIETILDDKDIVLLNNTYSVPNHFEYALISGNQSEIERYLENQELMLNCGYAMDEYQILYDNYKQHKSEINIEGGTVYQIQKRVYLIQQNKNRQAEKLLLLWYILGGNDVYEDIINILMKEQRHKEARVAYTRFRNYLKQDLRISCLNKFILSRVYNIAIAAEQELALLVAKGGVVSVFQHNNTVVEKKEISSLLDIARLLDNSFVYYITQGGSELQDFILHQDLLDTITALKINRGSSELIQIIQSGNYPRGVDALSTAKRAFIFVGAWKGLAKKCAAFAADSTEKAELLWDVYKEENDTDNMLSVLVSDEKLQCKHMEVYIDILYKKRDYTSLVNFSQKYPKDIPDSAVAKILISKILIGVWEPDDLNMLGICSRVSPYDDLVSLSLSFYECKMNEMYVKLIAEGLELFVSHFEISEVKNIISAGGKIKNEEIVELLSATNFESNPFLCAFIHNNYLAKYLPEQVEGYYWRLKNELSDIAIEDKVKIFKKLGTAFPNKSIEFENERFEADLQYLLINYGSLSHYDDIKNLLQKDPIDQNKMQVIIKLLAPSDLIARDGLYELVYVLAEEIGMKDDVLRCLHDHRKSGDEDFAEFMCKIYKSQLEMDDIPLSYLNEIDYYFRDRLHETNKLEFAYLLLKIAQKKGIKEYINFADNAIKLMDVEHSEDSEDVDDVQESNFSSELDCFVSVLNNQAIDFDDYINFCASFSLYSENDKEIVEHIMVAKSGDSISEEDSVSILHQLYEYPDIDNSWSNCNLLPLKEEPIIYSRLLLIIAMRCNNDRKEWQFCIDYCLKNERHNDLFEAIYLCIKETNQNSNVKWYDLKYEIKIIEDYCSNEKLIAFIKNASFSMGILKEFIKFFQKIEINAASDENHNALRAIIGLSSILGKEDFVIGQLKTSLIGIHKKLGLAMVIRLIKGGKYEQASQFLKELDSSFGSFCYDAFIKKLAGWSLEELAEWDGSHAGKIMEDFLLPDGNDPDILRLRIMAMHCLDNALEEDGIRVMREIISYFPNDFMCYQTLFILCKNQYINHMEDIILSLKGMYLNYRGNSSTYLSFSKSSILTYFTIASAVISNSNGDRKEDVVEFIRGNVFDINNNIDRILSEKIQLFDGIRNEFRGIDSIRMERLKHILMGTVVSNWYSFFIIAYQNMISSEELSSYLKYVSFNQRGIKRSILRFVKDDSNYDETLYRVEWLLKGFDQAVSINEKTKRSIKYINKILEEVDIQMIPEKFLCMPWEEGFIGTGEEEDIKRTEISSCYQWMWEKYVQNSEDINIVKQIIWLLLRMDATYIRIRQFFSDTQKLFNVGKYELAGICYEILCKQKTMPFSVNARNNPDIEEKKRMQIELYQAKQRICKVFCGNAYNINKMKDLNLHSCMNMIVSLLQSPRANELGILSKFFNGRNLKLIRDVLSIVTPEISDEAKVEIFESHEGDNQMQICLATILLSKNKIGREYLFIKDASMLDDVISRYEKIYQRTNVWKEKLMKFETPPHRNAFQQIEEIRSVELSHPLVSVSDSSMISLPSIVSDLHVLSESEIDETTETILRQNYASLAISECKKREECSAKLFYYLWKKEGIESEKTLTSMIEYIKDYRYSRLVVCKGLEENGDAEQSIAEKRTITRLVLEVACYLNDTGNATICRNDFFSGTFRQILQDAHNMSDLIENFSSNKKGYLSIPSLIADEKERDVSNNIANIISQLSARSEILGPKESNYAEYKILYQNAYNQLSAIPYNRNWLSTINYLLQLCRQANTKLEERPSVTINKVFEPEKNGREDIVAGTIVNTGRVTASDVKLHAVFQNGDINEVFKCDKILAGREVCFAVDYKLNADVDALSFELTPSYSYRNKEYTSDTCKGNILVQDNPRLLPLLDPYGADAPICFTIEDDGTVYGDGLYGRSNERAMLEQLVAGNTFAYYKSAVLQGFRRAGKTSLLNYFLIYLKANRKDVLSIYVSAQGISFRPIQRIFIDQILMELKLMDLSEFQEQFEELTYNWELDKEAEDRNPADLVSFYHYLRKFLDVVKISGVILLIDEIDVLFNIVEKGKYGSYDSLFSSIRTIQQDPTCRETIKMVICGSNKLLKYNRQGGSLHQMFQNFSTISVGQLAFEDIKQLLQASIGESGEMVFTDEAVNWAYRLTGGLVWHAKLLGNQVMHTVRKEGRYYIYPSDVYQALDSLKDKDMLQFSDECTDDEKAILEAVASLAEYREEYISFEQILNRLNGRVTQSQLIDSLDILCGTLDLLKRSATNRNAYAFSVEIYRRYFRNHCSQYEMNVSIPEMMITNQISEEEKRANRKPRIYSC